MDVLWPPKKKTPLASQKAPHSPGLPHSASGAEHLLKVLDESLATIPGGVVENQRRQNVKFRTFVSCHLRTDHQVLLNEVQWSLQVKIFAYLSCLLQSMLIFPTFKWWNLLLSILSYGFSAESAGDLRCKPLNLRRTEPGVAGSGRKACRATALGAILPGAKQQSEAAPAAEQARLEGPRFGEDAARKAFKIDTIRGVANSHYQKGTLGFDPQPYFKSSQVKRFFRANTIPNRIKQACVNCYKTSCWDFL